MWTEVFVSQERAKAQAIAALLEENNIMTMVRASGTDGKEGTFTVLVPQTELEAAQELIIDREISGTV